jgi:hypothetical protein
MIKRFIKIILFSITILGCQKPHVATVDPELQFWFQHFENQIQASTEGVSGIFDDSVPYALCVFNDLSVRVNPEVWKQAPYNEKEFIMFHELGHCAKGLPHDNSKTILGCPKSIMSEYSFWDTTCYTEWKFDLFDELRNK